MLSVQVLGPGCANCLNLEQLCKEVISENNIDAVVEKVTGYKAIMGYGIMSTPGLVINDKVVHTGKLPAKAILTHWLMNALARQESRYCKIIK